MKKEIFRAKEENFQDLLDYRKSINGKLGGCTTIRHDFGTGDYVLVHSDKSFGAHVIEGAIRMSELMADFENHIKEELKA